MEFVDLDLVELNFNNKVGRNNYWNSVYKITITVWKRLANPYGGGQVC